MVYIYTETNFITAGWHSSYFFSTSSRCLCSIPEDTSWATTEGSFKITTPYTFPSSLPYRWCYPTSYNWWFPIRVAPPSRNNNQWKWGDPFFDKSILYAVRYIRPTRNHSHHITFALCFLWLQYSSPPQSPMISSLTSPLSPSLSYPVNGKTISRLRSRSPFKEDPVLAGYALMLIWCKQVLKVM